MELPKNEIDSSLLPGIKVNIIIVSIAGIIVIFPISRHIRRWIKRGSFQ